MNIILFLLLLGMSSPAVFYMLVCGVVALLIKLDDPKGRIFFFQIRMVAPGRVVKAWKFRTVKTEFCSHDHQNLILKLDDPRLTKIGRYLKQWHLDELPQVLQAIIFREFNIIGPRLMMWRLHRARVKECPDYARRLARKQGVLGLAQLLGPENHLPGDFRTQLMFDLYYIEHEGLLLDLCIVLATVEKIVLRRVTPWFLPDNLAAFFEQTPKRVEERGPAHTSNEVPITVAAE